MSHYGGLTSWSQAKDQYTIVQRYTPMEGTTQDEIVADIMVTAEANGWQMKLLPGSSTSWLGNRPSPGNLGCDTLGIDQGQTSEVV